MTDLVEDFNTTIAHPGEDDLTQMRVNWKWILMTTLLNGVRDQKKCLYAPGYTVTVTSTSSPGDFTHPDSILAVKGLDQYRFNLTWTGDNLTTIVCQHSDGTTSPEFSTVTGGTISASFDGSGNMTGASSA